MDSSATAEAALWSPPGKGIPKHPLSCSPALQGPTVGQQLCAWGSTGVWAGKEGDIFAVAPKAKAFLWIWGPGF